MKFRFFRSKQSLSNRLIEAERHPQPTVVMDDAELLRQVPTLTLGSGMSAEEEGKYHRIRAMMQYGEESENLADRALLTEGERDYLEAYSISKRWAKFQVQQMRPKTLR